jgi:hypothetical protein
MPAIGVSCGWVEQLAIALDGRESGGRFSRPLA